MKSIRNPQNDRTSFSYDAAGRRTLRELANGTRATYLYDAASNLTRIANLKSDSSTISQYDYTYNAASKRTQIVSADGSLTTYTYDAIYQLTGEHRSGTTPYHHAYLYDPVQNRTVKVIDGVRTTSTFDAANQLVTTLGSTGTTTYTFDANGNEILIVQPDGSRTTTMWDFENRSSVIATPANGTQTQAYDPDGLRVKKQDSTGTTHIIYDGQAYLLETNASNTTVAVYTQEPTTYGYLTSQYRFDGTLWVPGYYQQDALGSTMQLTDAGENVTDTYEYDAWGIVQDRTGTTENPFEWIGAWGYYKDQTTGLYYVRARNYQPITGRWTSTDPLLFVDGPNLYVAYFVPNEIDPSGMIGGGNGAYLPGISYGPPSSQYWNVDPNGFKQSQEERQQLQFNQNMKKLQQELQNCCECSSEKSACLDDISRITSSMASIRQKIRNSGGAIWGIPGLRGLNCSACERTTDSAIYRSKFFNYQSVQYLSYTITHAWGQLTCRATGDVIATIDFWDNTNQPYTPGPNGNGWTGNNFGG